MDTPRLFGLVVCALLSGSANSARALESQGPAEKRSLSATDEVLSPSSSPAPADPRSIASCEDEGCCVSPPVSRWTTAADFIILQRCGGTSQTLVEHVPGVPTTDRVPGSSAFGRLFSTPGVAGLSGNDFPQGFCGGPRLSLLRHGDCGYDLELSYFQIDGWRSERTVLPNDPAECLVMRAPGQWVSPATTPGGWPGWIQTNQSATQGMAWEYATQLHNGELNVHWSPADGVTLLGGFRWVNLSESLAGALSPPTIATEPPFWNTTTSNNLYGFQLGAAGNILQRGRLAIDGLVKAGIYDDAAEQTTAVSVIAKQVRSASASTDHAAFVGETGLQCSLQLTSHLTLRAGYEVLWLEGVALAPGQIQQTYTTTQVFANSVQALGVNCNCGAFYHGATVGAEYAF